MWIRYSEREIGMVGPAFCPGLNALRSSEFFEIRAKTSTCTQQPQIHGRLARKRVQMQVSQLLIGVALKSIIGTLKKASDSNEQDRTTKVHFGEKLPAHLLG
mmetsp:Transcript_263/g.648  ORF Transcript_263/g.648 Transcript_263/m.648 type:complete len:102 (+) Transcript_263:334-639(+)